MFLLDANLGQNPGIVSYQNMSKSNVSNPVVVVKVILLRVLSVRLLITTRSREQLG